MPQTLTIDPAAPTLNRGLVAYGPEYVLAYGEAAGATSEVVSNGQYVETITGGYSPLQSISFINGELGASVRVIDGAATASGLEATIDDGVVTGEVAIGWRAGPGWGEEKVVLDIGSPPSSATRVHRFVAGTLGDAMTSSLETLLDAEETTPDIDLLSASNLPTSATRSTTHWLHGSGADLTGFAVSLNNNNNGRGGGVPITRRHLLGCNHYGLRVGNVLRFLTAANEVVSRTIIGEATTPTAEGDMRIVTLSSDLPESIASYKVFPAAVYDKLVPPEGASVWGPLAFWIDQNNRVKLHAWRFTKAARGAAVFNGTSHDVYTTSFLHPVAFGLSQPKYLSDYAAYGSVAVDYDSSAPSCAMIGTDVVVLSAWTSASTGPNYAGASPLLNDAIAHADADGGVATGYSVIEFDVSGYPAP